MSLAKKLLFIPPAEPGLPCGIAKIKKQMSKIDFETLEVVMNVVHSESKRISNRQIHEVLLSEGYDIAYSSITLHRRKQCRCFVGKIIRARLTESSNV